MKLKIFALIRTVHKYHSESETWYHFTVSYHSEVIQELLQVRLELKMIVSGIRSPIFLHCLLKFSLTVSMCLKLPQIIFVLQGSRNGHKTGCG